MRNTTFAIVCNGTPFILAALATVVTVSQGAALAGLGCVLAILAWLAWDVDPADPQPADWTGFAETCDLGGWESVAVALETTGERMVRIGRDLARDAAAGDEVAAQCLRAFLAYTAWAGQPGPGDDKRGAVELGARRAERCEAVTVRP